jgi:starvation-inducible DNA-binding protein
MASGALHDGSPVLEYVQEIEMYGTASSVAEDFEPRREGERRNYGAASPYLLRRETMTVNIGLSDKQRNAVVSILDTVLADEFVLYTKSRRFHWNVEGANFAELHALFEKQYEQLDEIVDRVAERARALGGMAAGSLEEYLSLTRLKEEARDRYDAGEMIRALLADHETLIRSLRKDLETCSKEHSDEGTADFLTGLMQDHEKSAWMLRAYLR